MPPSRLLVLAIVFVSPVGCSPTETWPFTLAPDEGKVRIDMPRLALVFEGVSLDTPAGGHVAGATGTQTVSGPGTSRVAVTVGDTSLENSYARGQNSMTLEGYSLELLENGTLVRIGDQEFDLTAEKKTIVIGTDGTAHLQKVE